MDSSPTPEESGYKIQQHLERKPHKSSAKLVSFISAFLILLASIFVVNISLSTINSVEAKSQSAQDKIKTKKYIKTSQKSRRSKKSRKGRKSKKRYRKAKRTSRNKKRFYKTTYKKSKRSRKSRKSYRKSRKKSRRGRRHYRTCDQLSSSTLNRKARRYQKTINHAARKHGVSQHFIKAIITVETCFRSGLRGTSGEKGLMQLMPTTAKRFGVRNRFSTWENIHGGTRYLSYLLRHFSGNKAYAAAAYNGGRGAVSKKRGPKFAAVRRYSRKVMNAYRKFRPGRIQVKSRKRKSRKKNKS